MMITPPRASRRVTVRTPAAREALVDALARDARALLAALDGKELPALLTRAAALLASVTGQDLDEGADGVFRIARRVAADRIISTVDPEARHGHKTPARGFDGCKGHVAIDPEAELITATAVTAGNTGDAVAAAVCSPPTCPPEQARPAPGRPLPQTRWPPLFPLPLPALPGPGPGPGEAGETAGQPAAGDEEQLAVYGDAAYGAGELLDTLEQVGADIYCKAQPPATGSPRMPSESTWRPGR